jgi:hypothetical protein
MKQLGCSWQIKNANHVSTEELPGVLLYVTNTLQNHQHDQHSTNQLI